MKIKKRNRLFGILAIIVLILFISSKVYIRNENIRAALEYGHLSKLPDSANHIKVETKGGFFSRSFWLEFESTDIEIKNWIKNSQKLEHKDLSVQPDKSYVYYSKIYNKEKNEWIEITCSTSLLGDQPKWFNTDSLEKFDFYEIPIDEEMYYGKVWVDLKNQKVYVYTAHS